MSYKTHKVRLLKGFCPDFISPKAVELGLRLSTCNGLDLGLEMGERQSPHLHVKLGCNKAATGKVRLPEELFAEDLFVCV